MIFPLEIYRLILRAATCVPGALDTSHEAIRNEDRETMLTTIAESMTLKCTLCLVDKMFNSITEEFLYEIITIHRFCHIPNLVKCLRTITRNGQIPGMLCRRLDFYLGQRGHSYISEEVGRLDMLWGLMPLCPNISVFICRLRDTHSQTHSPPLQEFPLFWRAIVAVWASSLRRMEILGTGIPENDVGTYLRYFRYLEICYIAPSDPYPMQSHEIDEDDDTDEDEDTDEDYGSTDEEEETHALDTEAEALIQRYQDIAASGWPPYDAKSPYVLPCLHTLHFDPLPQGLSQCRFPNLRILGAYDPFWNSGSPNDTYLLFEEMSVACSESSSLTRFTQGSTLSIDVWKIFDSFPYLTELTLYLSTRFRASPRVHYQPRYQQTSLTWLRLIDVAPNKDFDLEASLEVLSYARSGIFPSLKHISILTNPRTFPLFMSAINFERFNAMGVTIDVSSNIQSFLYANPHEQVYP